MSRRSSSLNNFTLTAITREIGSKYDDVKEVADNIDTITAIADSDILNLTEEQLTNAALGGEAYLGLINMEAVANTLGSGSDASVNYDNGILTLGIPRGANGINGSDGLVPDVEFSVDTEGNLQYEVVGYLPLTGTLVEEW